MSLFIVDCSVAVQWYFTESNGEHSLRMLGDGHAFVAPGTIQAEFANVCWKKARRRDITADEALDALGVFPPPALTTIDDSVLALGALEFALEHDLTAYDSLYAVLAFRRQCPLVTSDERLLTVIAGVEPDLVLRPADVA